MFSSLKSPSAHFDIRKFVTFSENSTRSGAHRKMVHVGSMNLTTANAYFMRLPRLWNSLPRIDLEQSIPTIKAKLSRFMFNHQHFHQAAHVLSTSSVHVQPAQGSHMPLSFYHFNYLFNSLRLPACVGCPSVLLSFFVCLFSLFMSPV